MASHWTYEMAVKDILRQLGRNEFIVGKEDNGLYYAYAYFPNKQPVLGSIKACCFDCAFDSCYEEVYLQMQAFREIPEKNSRGTDTLIPVQNTYCDHVEIKLITK